LARRNRDRYCRFKRPAGGRCTLYARYAEALSEHSGLTMGPHCPDSEPREEPPPPAMVTRGQGVEPPDGAIVAPEDIIAVLNPGGAVRAD